jgi:hypothetical protein
MLPVDRDIKKRELRFRGIVCFNVTAATLMQHLLFLFLLVVTPIWDLYDARKLKRNPSSEQKIRY